MGEFLCLPGSILAETNPLSCRFDPRCQFQYVWGKHVAERGGDPLFITQPFLGFDHKALTQSAALPIIDTRNNEYIAQAKVRLDAKPVYDALNSSQTRLNGGGFPVLISVPIDETHEAVALKAPTLEFGETGDLEGLLLPNDKCEDFDATSISCERSAAFAKMIKDMTAGKTGQAQILRTSESGGTERLNFAFAPVEVPSLRAIDPSNFSRGVRGYKATVFSIALAQTDEGLLDSWSSMRKELESISQIMIGFMGFLIAVWLFAVVVALWCVALSIVRPVIDLLELVKKINR